jgi:hypothetical protein
MKRMIVVFVAGTLAGGAMGYLFWPGKTVDNVDSSSAVADGENVESASSRSRPGRGPPADAIDNTEAADSAGRDALAVLDDALAIESFGDRQRAVRGAIELLDALPSLARPQLARQFAAHFAAVDPDAAIEWARSTRLPRVFDEVLAVLADSDPYRALELAAEAGGSDSLDRVVKAAVNSSATPMSEFADALVASPPSLAKDNALPTLTGAWAERDSEAAIEWMLGRPSDESWILLRNVVNRLQNDPAIVEQYVDLTERYFDRLPQQVRSDWLRNVTSAYAYADPEAALDWIERFRGLPEYEVSREQAIGNIATFDSAAASAIIASHGLWSDATRVVSLWSRYDIDGASAWAAAIPDPTVRQAELISLGNRWANTDPDGAQRFVAGLPANTERDRILDRMLRSALNRDNWTLIARLIPFYSSSEAREQGAAEFSTRIARGYESEARRLMERYVTDPALWDQFEARLTR